MKENAAAEHDPERKTLFDKMVARVISCLRGKRVYTPALVEAIAKVWTSPSAGGSRSAISRIVTHVSDYFCKQTTGTYAR